MSTTTDQSNISYGATIWGFANNQPNTAPPPGSDINFQIFSETPFWGPPYASIGPWNGWGQSGDTAGDDVIYGLSAKTSSTNYNLRQYTGLTYNWDNNPSGGFLGSADIDNGLGSPASPFFYQNGMDVTVQMWDSQQLYQVGGVSASVPATVTQSGLVVTAPTAPILKYVYWRIIISNGQSDPNANINLSINGTSYITGGSIPQYNSNLVFDWTTYGAATVDSTGKGYTGAFFDISIL